MLEPDASMISDRTDKNRAIVIVIYCLYLAALVSVGIAGIAGVILAYVKRGDEPAGSVWRSHFENQVQAFWIWVGLVLVGWLVWWLGLSFIVIIGAAIYFMYRTLRGLVRALDNRPY